MRSNGGRQRQSGIGWFVGPLSRTLEVPHPWEWTPLEWSLQGDRVEECQFSQMGHCESICRTVERVGAQIRRDTVRSFRDQKYSQQ